VICSERERSEKEKTINSQRQGLLDQGQLQARPGRNREWKRDLRRADSWRDGGSEISGLERGESERVSEVSEDRCDLKVKEV
jgi:hypothetical protein